MTTAATNSSVKTIGLNGQISLGKQFAGTRVLVEEREPGEWLIRTVVVIPTNEFWLHETPVKQVLARAISNASTTAASSTSDVDALFGEVASRSGVGR